MGEALNLECTDRKQYLSIVIMLYNNMFLFLYLKIKAQILNRIVKQKCQENMKELCVLYSVEQLIPVGSSKILIVLYLLF
jgi:hypothetical protein